MWNAGTQTRCLLGRLTARQADGGLDWEAERSECPDVMAGILGERFPAP